MDKKIKVAEIDRDPQQPRKLFDEAELLSLADNMKRHGQQVPVIVYPALSRFILLDGERRWRACQIAKIEELAAIVLPGRPSAAQLAILAASIDFQKAQYTLMERSNLLAKIKAEQGWNVGELAEQMSMKQPLVSKLLSYQKLAPEVQELLHTGKLDGEKAFILSQKDAAEQLQLLKQAGTLSRDQLRTRAKSNGQQSKSKRAVFALGNGLSVTMQGGEVTLAEAISHLIELVKQLKKSSKLDIDTVQRVLRDKAKA